ncbi:transposase [Maridesulfovibrio sp. FT414]|uniref:transposase n=1 Tax=Maridesulfovibrio sp. FT414 TaxID=2979469 RepID=UPI003D805007
MSKTRNSYSIEFKKEAAQQYINGDESLRKVCARLGIADDRTLRDWVGKVQRGESLEDGRGKGDHPRREQIERVPDL